MPWGPDELSGAGFGDALAEFTEALRSSADALRGLEAGARATGRAEQERGKAAAGGAVSRGRGGIIRPVIAAMAAGTAAQAAVQMGLGRAESFEAGYMKSFMSAWSKMPVFGQIFREANDPIDRAAARTLAMTGEAARLGAPEEELNIMRRRGLQVFYPEELAFRDEERRVAKMFASERVIMQSMEGTALGKAIDKLIDVLEDLGVTLREMKEHPQGQRRR